MNKSEFDQHAAQYDQVLADAIPLGLNEDSYFSEYKISLMANRLTGKNPARILDFGCGAGRSLTYIEKYFPHAEVWGYDVSLTSLEIAAERSPCTNVFADWNAISDIRFDAIIATNVFHHIPPEQRKQALQRCRVALNDTGEMFIFEHNPYNPVTRWIFERCPFDANAEMISLKNAKNLIEASGFSVQSCGYTLFFPRPLSFLRPLESWIKFLPLGAQYYIQMKSK
jgi:cyclopropane fatty-acyl-phospholipid synthase-like methyltransferase